MIQYITQEPIWLTTLTQKVDSFLHKNPRVYKVAIVINHLIRATCMVGMMYLLPFSPLTNCLIGFGISFEYRVVPESKCFSFRFSLASAFGASAYLFGREGLAALCSGVAFSSLRALALASTTIVPLALYAAAILIIANNDVDLVTKRQRMPSCCSVAVQ